MAARAIQTLGDLASMLEIEADGHAEGSPTEQAYANGLRTAATRITDWIDSNQEWPTIYPA